MAFYDLEEQEKIAELKEWWRENGPLVILGVSAFIIGLAGVQGWRYYQRTQAESAALVYEQLEQAARGRDLQKIKDAAAEVTGKYGSTAYGGRAALLAAKAAYELGDNATAEMELKWAVANAKEDELRDVARFRLAGVLLDGKKYDDGLKLLEEKHAAAFNSLYLGRKGDVLAAQGKLAEARAAYQAALDSEDNKSAAYRAYLQLRRDALEGAK